MLCPDPIRYPFFPPALLAQIDSILSVRKENEHEASRRLKTEVLVQMDGASTDQNDRILVMGATNLPW